jgi:hypothetical protein
VTMSDAALIDNVCAALKQHGASSLIALAGVPATGKSHVAHQAALAFARHKFFVTAVQFHAGYAYEDFVEGYRPLADGGFELRDGALLRTNQAALRDPTNQYLLLIEEFTRANTSAVLGELLTYIEHRTRTFQLPSGRRVRLAPNLTFLATFNPLDRTALELDDAVIRRLRILELPPSEQHFDSLVRPESPREQHFSLVMRDEFKALIDKLGAGWDGDLPFGHAVFKGVKSEKELQTLWDQQLRFLLRRPGLPPHASHDAVRDLVLTVTSRMKAHDAASAPVTPPAGAAPAATAS